MHARSPRSSASKNTAIQAAKDETEALLVKEKKLLADISRARAGKEDSVRFSCLRPRSLT